MTILDQTLDRRGEPALRPARGADWQPGIGGRGFRFARRVAGKAAAFPGSVFGAVRAHVLQWIARPALRHASKLCLGSGRAPIEGWTNIDLDAPVPFVDARLDLRYPLPIRTGQIELIYSEHVLEHFDYGVAARLLAECRRVLRPGGRLRVAVPDLDRLIRHYAELDGRAWNDQDWVRWPSERDQIDSPARMLNRAFRGWGHRFLYDEAELVRQLRAAGFGEVSRVALGRQRRAGSARARDPSRQLVGGRRSCRLSTDKNNAMGRIPITRPTLPPLDEFTRLLEQVWDTRMLSNFSSFAQQLESIATGYLQTPSRVVVSGDVGLTCTISCMDIPAGSTCLVPSFTFNSTIQAVLWNRLVPVFVDIDPQTLNMDPVEATRRAEESGASLIVATHVFGNPCDDDALGELARSAGVPLLYDAAHVYGSKRGGVHVGSLGTASVFSLSGTKPVTCAEGGLVSSHDPELLRRLEYARGYGFQFDYESKWPGLNGKMSEIHAALGTLTLTRIEDALKHRAQQVARYRDAVQGTNGAVSMQSVRDVDRSTFKDLALLFERGADRDAVERDLDQAGYQTKRYFRPCHQMAMFAPYSDGPLPATESVYERILCVPLYADLSDGHIDRITDIVSARVHGLARR